MREQCGRRVGHRVATALAPGTTATDAPEHQVTTGQGAMALQGLVQGAGQGVVTLIAYGRAVAFLGVSRAVLFAGDPGDVEGFREYLRTLAL